MKKVSFFVVVSIFCALIGLEYYQDRVVWTVEQSSISGYSLGYKYESCSVDVQSDGMGVMVSVNAHNADGSTDSETTTFQKTPDGAQRAKILWTAHYSQNGQYLGPARGAVFYNHCRKAAQEGLPRSAKKAFHGFIL